MPENDPSEAEKELAEFTECATYLRDLIYNEKCAGKTRAVAPLKNLLHELKRLSGAFSSVHQIILESEMELLAKDVGLDLRNTNVPPAPRTDSVRDTIKDVFQNIMVGDYTKASENLIVVIKNLTSALDHIKVNSKKNLKVHERLVFAIKGLGEAIFGVIKAVGLLVALPAAAVASVVLRENLVKQYNPIKALTVSFDTARDRFRAAITAQELPSRVGDLRRSATDFQEAVNRYGSFKDKATKHAENKSVEDSLKPSNSRK